MKKENNQIYNFWNGKNINGNQAYYGMTKEQKNNNETSELHLEVSSETLSADDLQ